MTIPRSVRRTLQGADGRGYELMISWPSEPAPPAGYPAIYLLDGNATFGSMTEAIRLRSRRSDATGVGPAVVVGIGYATEQPYDSANRSFDYTPARADRPSSDASHGDRREGGAEAFRAFIERRVKPAVQEIMHVDTTREYLFGASLGGLFTLQTLLTAPASFDRYVIVSPSIWWDPAGLDAAFERARVTCPDELRQRRVLVTAGEYEQTLAPWQTESATGEMAARRRERRMVDAAREMAERLVTVTADTQFLLFEGEDHASTLSLSINACLRFCLAPLPAAVPLPERALSIS